MIPRKPWGALVLAAVLATAPALYGARPAASEGAKADPAPSTAEAPEPKAKAAPLDPMTIAGSVEVAIRTAADKVAPAVVNIVVTREGGGGMEPFETLPEDLHDLLERYLRERPDVPFRTRANGSGFIISADGFILTSEHVVRGAVEIEVTLATRKKYAARVVGADPRRDLAVIRIGAKGLPVARFGDATKVRRGQFVIALGSPFGFGRDGQASLSFGIVSGTGRAIAGAGRALDRYYGNLIQTDAAINPGNSGGPVVTLDGAVIGVSAIISSRAGSSDGVGFAVPITERTRAIIECLKRGEEVAYGFLGIEIQEVAEEVARETGAESGEGAYLALVLPNTPADRAGLKQGDVILSVGEEPVHGPDDVIQIVQATPVGQEIVLLVLRDGKRRNVEVEVGRRPGPEPLLARRSARPWWRGMRVVPLTRELREGTGLEPHRRGVFVQQVRDASPAADAGIVPGMVIDQVGPQKVASVREFLGAAAEVGGPCFVHVVGVGVKVIRAPGAEKEPAEEPDEEPGPEGQEPEDEKPVR